MIPRLVPKISPCDGFCDGAGGGQGHSSMLMNCKSSCVSCDMKFTSSFFPTQSLTRPPQLPAAVRQGPSTSPLKCLPSSKCLPRLATQVILLSANFAVATLLVQVLLSADFPAPHWGALKLIWPRFKLMKVFLHKLCLLFLRPSDICQTRKALHSSLVVWRGVHS